MKTLQGKVVVVTGARRGIGKGVALVLGSQGATVYVTGRTKATQDNLSGTIHEVAEAITVAGGVGIAVICDHIDDNQVKALFERVKSEQGHLDLLVNNVTTLSPEITNPPPFWNKPLSLADEITVGLRSAYVATYYAAPLLLEAKKALVVNISYYGAVSYHLDPAYGATKAGLDKMTWDMAQDFKPHSVAVVSVWPGPTTTEMTTSLISQIPGGNEMMETFETPQFTGRVLTALYGDPEIMTKSGQVVIGAEAALEYGFTDFNGKQPPSLREQQGSPHRYSGPGTEEGIAQDESQIRALIEERAEALRNKSVARTLATQTDDYIQYGLQGPLRSSGDLSIDRDAMEKALSQFDGPLEYEIKDLTIAFAGNVGISHSLSRIGGQIGNVTFGWWFRKTVGFAKIGGSWKITHEHESVPIAADGTGRAATDLTPDSHSQNVR